MKENKTAGMLFLFFLLFSFWLILATNVHWSTVVVGLLAAALIVIYNNDMVFAPKDVTRLGIKSIIALFGLGLTLMREIIKANIDVVKIVLHPKLPIDPGFTVMRQPLKKELNRMFFGNAITLTPGTLTVELDETTIVVHELVRKDVPVVMNSPIEKAFIRYEEAEK